MKTTLILSIITIIGIFFSPGRPVPGAEVYIEQEGSGQPVLFQPTGDNGKLTISNLSGGLYRIKINLPQQSGKFMRGFDRIDCRLQVGYHNKKKKYFIRESEGCFTVDQAETLHQFIILILMEVVNGWKSENLKLAEAIMEALL